MPRQVFFFPDGRPLELSWELRGPQLNFSIRPAVWFEIDTGYLEWHRLMIVDGLIRWARIVGEKSENQEEEET